MKHRLAFFASLHRSPLSILCVLPALLAAAPSSADENRFVGLRKCAVCHGKELMGDQVAAWRSGVHAGAVETLRSTESIEIAKQLGVTEPPHEAAACIHARSRESPHNPHRISCGSLPCGSRFLSVSHSRERM